MQGAYAGRGEILSDMGLAFFVRCDRLVVTAVLQVLQGSIAAGLLLQGMGCMPPTVGCDVCHGPIPPITEGSQALQNHPIHNKCKTVLDRYNGS